MDSIVEVDSIAGVGSMVGVDTVEVHSTAGVDNIVEVGIVGVDSIVEVVDIVESHNLRRDYVHVCLQAILQVLSNKLQAVLREAIQGITFF